MSERMPHIVTGQGDYRRSRRLGRRPAPEPEDGFAGPAWLDGLLLAMGLASLAALALAVAALVRSVA